MNQEHAISMGVLTDTGPRSFICGTPFDNLDKETALEKVTQYASCVDGKGARKVYFSNVHSIIAARRDHDLHQCLDTADLILPDGSGLKIAGKILGKAVIENLNGTDFTPKVLEIASENNWTVYLLGATAEILRECRARLHQTYPWLQIVGYHHGYFSSKENQRIVDDINQKRPNILLVALGTPIQEKWIDSHADILQVGACLAVGGLFDFLSGTKKRAPMWARKLGIEWVFRFFHDPKAKWYRVFVEIPLFLGLILWERFTPQKIKNRAIEKVYAA